MASLKTLKETWQLAKTIYGEHSAEAQAAFQVFRKQLLVNANRRARHAAYTDLGMVRVKGALGGTYYE